MAAAQAAVDRRKAFDALRAQRAASGAAPVPLDVHAVKKGFFVGQLMLKRDAGLRCVRLPL